MNVIAAYRQLEARILAALRADLREEEFGALALEAHVFQKRWNTPYANFCATRPAAAHWREIPAVPQNIFKSARLSVAPPDLVTRTFRTSGTTGETRGEHHFIDTQLYDAAMLRGWDLLTARRADATILLVPADTDAPHSSLAHMLGVLARERSGGMACAAVGADGRLDGERARAALAEAFSRRQSVALLGTALAFLHLSEQLGEARLAVRPGSFALETGGYKGSGRDVPKTELYAGMSALFGLPPGDIFNEYGMTELSSQFYTRGLGGAHEGPPWLRAAVFDPETGGEVAVGETGVLRIFDLANLGSVLAVETQDLAVRREGGFELLGRDPAALPRGCSRAADERMRA
ncbi:MAG: hypothetical protein K8R23_16295 [Chthoniobacter sp.]|nr:hypothetical protein [Chthoniobacter sp.]